MPQTKDITKVDYRGYSVTLGGVTIGWVNDVDPSALKLITTELKIGEIGDIPLDDVVIGLAGMIKVIMAQTDLASLRTATPWAPSSGSIPLTPSTQYQPLYSYAKPLVIHPRGVSDTSEDLTLLKAVPLPSWIRMSDGKKQRDLPVDFKIYPDRTQLVADTSVLAYGYIGPAPS